VSPSAVIVKFDKTTSAAAAAETGRRNDWKFKKQLSHFLNVVIFF
jgi:hypothetical protein